MLKTSKNNRYFALTKVKSASKKFASHVHFKMTKIKMNVVVFLPQPSVSRVHPFKSLKGASSYDENCAVVPLVFFGRNEIITRRQ